MPLIKILEKSRPRKKPVVHLRDDENHHSFWLLCQQGLYLMYYHLTYSFSLSMKIVMAAFIHFLLKPRSPALIRSYLCLGQGRKEWASEAGVSKGFWKPHQVYGDGTFNCPRRCPQEGKKTKLWGQPRPWAYWDRCVCLPAYQIFPSMIRENATDILKGLAPKNGDN